MLQLTIYAAHKGGTHERNTALILALNLPKALLASYALWFLKLQIYQATL